MKVITLNGGSITIVDDEDYDELAQFSWCEKKRSDGLGSYAYRYVRHDDGRWRTVRMHKQIMRVTTTRVDHRDGNGLNNMRSNLRVATQTQNAQNARVLRVTERQRKKASRFKGVSYALVHKRDTLSKPWRCRIRVDGQLINIGWFATEEAAALAYNNAALQHFGDFANLNEVAS